MSNSDPEIPNADDGIPGAEADGSLDKLDHVVYRAGKKFAFAERT